MMCGRKLFGGLRHCREQSPYFFRSASGKYEQPIANGIESVFFGKRSAISPRLLLFINSLDKRVPDEMSVLQTCIAIDLFLKWQNDEHLIYHLLQLIDPRRMPRPHLR